ncbi:hypothetical protein CJ030_MR8G022031 [Morella rubra]|uniref:Uncharacterized protein n=1 Tax=Morella rubra TaxID=262757 RepID=A0A6A1UQS4_9ROSI|nr:hypothetical protein CJ030_MR8G022031 [Morella rubra]
MASLHLLHQRFQNLPSFTTPLLPPCPLHIPYLTSFRPFKAQKPLRFKTLTVPFALTESSDSPKSLEPNSLRSLLQQLANSLDLPQDYFAQLPRDLRLDLNDAAFDLSSGPVIDEVR